MSIRPNRVKQRLAAGKVATILAGTNDPDLIDQLGPLGADGIWLEGEHGGVDYADLGNLTRACELWGKASVVRVMDNDYATIYRTLDRGAQAIVVPHVNSRDEAEAVVAAGKFAPLGKRGMFTSRQGFGVDDYFKTANDQSMLMVLIEDIAAIPRLDEILKVDHIDVFFVAPSDLATSMGHIGNVGHPDVQRTIDGALTKIVQAGRVAGTLVSTANVERYTRLGVRVAGAGGDAPPRGAGSARPRRRMVDGAVSLSDRQGRSALRRSSRLSVTQLHRARSVRAPRRADPQAVGSRGPARGDVQLHGQ